MSHYNRRSLSISPFASTPAAHAGIGEIVLTNFDDVRKHIAVITMQKLKPENLPPALVELIPMAEKWGISDDGYREDAVRKASVAELEMLVHSIDNIADEDLYGWLGGPESYSENPTNEYIAITCLTMAIVLAKVLLKKRS
jgi:hypothetical protein